MWIVKLALSRPYTFVVASILILILGALRLLHADGHFSEHNIPVSASSGPIRPGTRGHADRIVSITERALTTTVDNIEHVESQSLMELLLSKFPAADREHSSRAFAQITGGFSDPAQAVACGVDPPPHSCLQRVECHVMSASE